MGEHLDQWPFVLGAYALGILGTAWLIIASWTAMRRKERERAALKREPKSGDGQ